MQQPYILDFKTKGFVALAYPPQLRSAVQKAVISWKAFCALPEEIKKGLPYSNNADGVGYEIKDGSGPNGDHKENFDLSTSGIEWLENHGREVGNSTALSFIENATSLISVMRPLIIHFASDIEKTFGIPGFKDEVAESSNLFFVRFIHYFGERDVNQETASAHADQSGFTLHLFESDPGLQSLGFDGNWIDMPVSEGETVIIPGMQMQLRSLSEIKALNHRVIANNDTAQTGRFSAVCFVQLKNTPKYDKERFGRLQEMKAGFNYSIPYDEFVTFFKK